MADLKMGGFVLDARPDRVDFRDRNYRPPLVSLAPVFPDPAEIAAYLPIYHETSKILDQGSDGACTGFGLAAVINYIVWQRWVERDMPEDERPLHVSPWMLYDNARVYDEWEGEDYSGSSCRGAMKGWHKHGVCKEDLWGRATRSSRRPDPAWETDAALRPLGAYYRIDARSIADIQAAIREVRAIYCSARVHDGWMLKGRQEKTDIAGLPLPVIRIREKITGGHAFALVGYTCDGFIVQNSWGPGWGFKGFALLTYEDWIRNGDDAWVAAMAAPVRLRRQDVAPSGRSAGSLQVTALATGATPAVATPAASALRPWSESQAYAHCVVMGNDGKLLRRLVDTADAQDNLRKVAFDLPAAAIDGGARHLAIFAHGGLNSEEVALQRAMRMGPWFVANGIHPIFVVWRTSLAESLGQIGEDMLAPFLRERDELRSKGLGDLFDSAWKKFQDKVDNAFEVAAEKVVGKAVWTQMKQNAAAAAVRTGGTAQLLAQLGELLATRKVPLHMIGHSAGAILLGHMLDTLGDLQPKTVSLYAPACTMGFAARYYGKALERKKIAASALHVDLLSDENERDDTVGIYGKSLLYLVSRAFEDPRKMPLLGLARCWSDKTKLEAIKASLSVDFAESAAVDIRDWMALARKFGVRSAAVVNRQVITRRPPKQDPIRIDAVHGSFDNNVDVVNATLTRMLGTRPTVPVLDLTNF